MNQDQKIIEILHDFETFKLTDKEHGVYAHTSSYRPYVERIKALFIHNVTNCDCENSKAIETAKGIICYECERPK